MSDKGISPDPDKISAISEIKTPKSPAEVRSFNGMASYYRSFVPNFSRIAAPLFKIASSSVKDFVWTDVEEKCFIKLKMLLSLSPILSYPNFEEQFFVQTDACDTDLGAVFAQRYNDKEYVISYASRLLLPNEKNWSTREKEALGIIFACEKFRHYLIGSHFIVETDHQSLEWLLKAQAPARLV